jgi:hypothetical protein
MCTALLITSACKEQHVEKQHVMQAHCQWQAGKKALSGYMLKFCHRGLWHIMNNAVSKTPAFFEKLALHSVALHLID